MPDWTGSALWSVQQMDHLRRGVICYQIKSKICYQMKSAWVDRLFLSTWTKVKFHGGTLVTWEGWVSFDWQLSVNMPASLPLHRLRGVRCQTPSFVSQISSAQGPHIAETPKQGISYLVYNKCPLTDIEPTLVGNLINSQSPAVCTANYSWHLIELQSRNSFNTPVGILGYIINLQLRSYVSINSTKHL